MTPTAIDLMPPSSRNRRENGTWNPGVRDRLLCLPSNQGVSNSDYRLRESIDLGMIRAGAKKTGAQSQLSINTGSTWHIFVFPDQASADFLVEPIKIVYLRRDIAKTTNR